MRKPIVVLFAIAFVLFGSIQSVAPQMVNAQAFDTPMDTEAVFRAHYAAIEAGELETAMQYVTEEYISIVMPPPPGFDTVMVGMEPHSKNMELLIADNTVFDFINFTVQGDTLTAHAELHSDPFRAVDINPITFIGTAVVQDGMIVSETWVMEKHDRARLFAAIARANNKASLMRGYEEVFNKGNFDILDNEIAPNAIDHNFPELQGVDAFKIPLMGLREAFPDINATPEIIIAEGDIVMALTTFTGTHQGEFLGVPPSGEQLTWTSVDINRFENGQVVEA
ncbi:ester cyclase [Chloroflexi bacterium TSY]|nr:ester cyclase [Chloroflexi bacterium TSY]